MKSVPRVRGIIPTHTCIPGRSYVKELYDPEQWEKLLDCKFPGTPNRDGTIQGATPKPPPGVSKIEEPETISATGPEAPPKRKFFKSKKKIARKSTKKKKSGGA